MNIAVSISRASGSKFKPNRHGVLPLILSPLNGVLPAGAGVVDGTLLERLGLVEGQQAVLAINFTGNYTNPTTGKTYPNYSYTLVAKLGTGFENMVAQQVVASMNFNFGGGTPAPAVEVAPSPVVEEVEQTS